MFQKLLAIVTAMFPLPSFTDAEAVKAWLAKLTPTIGDLIPVWVNQFKATGRIEIECPDGTVCSMAPDANGVWTMTAHDQARLVSAAPEAFGDGKWLEILKQALPLLQLLLPLLLKKQAEPAPEPAPKVV